MHGMSFGTLELSKNIALEVADDKTLFDFGHFCCEYFPVLLRCQLLLISGIGLAFGQFGLILLT